jgi:hypothetical protein
MAISSSAEADATAGIDVFSGRPNPTWRMSRDEVDRLKRTWEALQASGRESMPAPLLGYRGCFVQDGDARWVAFGDVVTLQRPHGNESRKDEQHEIETLILNSAPPDVPVAALVNRKRIENSSS